MLRSSRIVCFLAALIAAAAATSSDAKVLRNKDNGAGRPGVQGCRCFEQVR